MLAIVEIYLFCIPCLVKAGGVVVGEFGAFLFFQTVPQNNTYAERVCFVAQLGGVRGSPFTEKNTNSPKGFIYNTERVNLI